MPLLRRQPFHREKPPPDLQPDEEVFHCQLTNEIFRDYEKFFERIILCNSLVWSCSFTGRSGLTYQEAVECEEKALKHLASFPDYLQRPILYLASLTHRGRIVDMNDDVFAFIKDRYFVGEIVDVNIGGARKSCKVVRVIAPAGITPIQIGSVENGDEEKKSSEKAKSTAVKPELYQYVLQENGKSNTFTAKGKTISRKKGLYTKDKSKLYLKQKCECDNGLWKVKAEMIKKLGLQNVKFEDFFAGPPPSFAVSTIKKKSSKTTAPEAVQSVSEPQITKQKTEKPAKDKKESQSATELTVYLGEPVEASPAIEARLTIDAGRTIEVSPTTEASPVIVASPIAEASSILEACPTTEASSTKSILPVEATDAKKKRKRSKKDKECDPWWQPPLYLDRSQAQLSDPSQLSDQQSKPLTLHEQLMQMTPEERAAFREKFKQDKLAEKEKKKEDLRKKRQEELQKKREKKALEREKKREEMRIQAEIMREYNRPREDLDCDDLQVMPEPVPVKCKIPADQFGDALMIVEFINCFSSLFDLKESFPKGFTLAILEEALLETDASGLMADLLLMMLTAIFSLQEEEDEEEKELSKSSKEQSETTEMMQAGGDLSMNQLIENATMMAQYPQLTHGIALSKLPLDNFTLTEILRLHILASGAQANASNARFRYQQRGGYMPIDDAALDFRRSEPDIVRSLGTENIYDIPTGDKVKILKVLVDQFLTYAGTRDLIEDNYERLRQMKQDLRVLQWTEQKREREETVARYKRRMEERMKEKERLEKKRLEKLKREEQQKNGEKTEDGDDKKEEEEEMEEDEPEMTAEEREELRQREDDLEADKKAEFAAKEREFFENIDKLIHGNAIYPLGRDRMYRRYWMLRNCPGLFVEENELFVDEDVIRPVPQNLKGADPKDFTIIPPKLVKRPAEDGSDKENDSMNASNLSNTLNSTLNSTMNTSLNVSTANNSINTSLVTSAANGTVVGNGVDPEHALEEKDGAIVISDEESEASNPPILEVEKKIELPPLVETPAVKQIMKRNKVQWAFFSTEEQINDLIQSLNSRGFREQALKQVLMEQKQLIIQNLAKCPDDYLTLPEEEVDSEKDEKVKEGKVQTVDVKSRHKNTKGKVKDNTAQEALELNLREMLLDLEERIYVGTLGYMKVDSRSTWRDAIENGSYNPQNSDPMFAKSEKKMDDGDKESTKDDDASSESSDDDSTAVVANDLAKALVQIEKGLDPKYLNPPFGEDEKTKQAAKVKAAQDAVLKKEEQKKSAKDREEEDSSESEDEEKEQDKTPKKTTLERWEESLLLSTSLSQVFLHLSTLEKAIAWSKSTLHARCKLCRRKGDAEKMLLCDICDRGHHMYCLKPPLKQVPQGDWYCPACKPKTPKRSPLKGRRRTFSEESTDEEDSEDDSDEEEDSDEESEEEDEEEEKSEEEDDENDNLCAVCSKGGTLICCDNCPLSYHLGCAKPQLKKVPKGRWLCQICSGKDHKAGKIKLPKGVTKKKTNMKVTPVSSRSSSKRGSPRDSPLTIKNPKKRKLADSDDEDRPKLKRNAKSASKLTQGLENGEDNSRKVSTSSRGNTKMHQLKMLEELVNEINEHDDAWPFLKPVSKKMVPDYYDVIKTPMDLSTIRNKINKFRYVEPEDLLKDVRQIFTNCIEYNKRSSVEFKAGMNLSKLFERKVKDITLDMDVASGPSAKRARTK